MNVYEIWGICGPWCTEQSIEVVNFEAFASIEPHQFPSMGLCRTVKTAVTIKRPRKPRGALISGANWAETTSRIKLKLLRVLRE